MKGREGEDYLGHVGSPTTSSSVTSSSSTKECVVITVLILLTVLILWTFACFDSLDSYVFILAPQGYNPCKPCNRGHNVVHKSLSSIMIEFG